jgi:transposase
MSDFREWEPLSHAADWLIFPQNIGTHLSIDEVALSQGELYTVVTNKKAKGRKNSIVAIVEGTKSEKIIEHISKINENKRRQVQEITLDMAGSMKLIAKKCFPKAVQVTDRFHVQKLALEALQEIRIKYRWDAIDMENEAIIKAKQQNKTYCPKVFENEDTPKQLLARSRYLLYKSPNDWTLSQKSRAKILFEQYPDIKTAYDLNQQLRIVYNTDKGKGVAMTRLAKWYDQVEKSGFKSFNTIMNTISLNYQTILNYFDNRSTNASAESFNSKIKAFRAQFRGVKNREFFLYRLTQIYA